MDSAVELKAEIEEIRNLLHMVISDKGQYDCSNKLLLDLSARMDKLILEYIKSGMD